MAMRIDKWLWVTRFFKTRSLAAAAIRAGRVRVEGERIKPSRVIQIGDHLQIQRQQNKFVVTVIGLSERRVSAKLAQDLYDEDHQARLERLAAADLRRFEHRGMRPPKSRPDSRSRRRLREFKGRD